MNFSLITLGELLSSQNETIKRNAFSILKQLQKERDKQAKDTQKYTQKYTEWYCKECKEVHTKPSAPQEIRLCEIPF